MVRPVSVMPYASTSRTPKRASNSGSWLALNMRVILWPRSKAPGGCAFSMVCMVKMVWPMVAAQAAACSK